MQQTHHINDPPIKTTSLTSHTSFLKTVLKFSKNAQSSVQNEPLHRPEERRSNDLLEVGGKFWRESLPESDQDLQFRKRRKTAAEDLYREVYGKCQVFEVVVCFENFSIAFFFEIVCCFECEYLNYMCICLF